MKDFTIAKRDLEDEIVFYYCFKYCGNANPN